MTIHLPKKKICNKSISSPKTIRDRVRNFNLKDIEINASQAYANAQSFNVRNFVASHASSRANALHLSPGNLKADSGLSASRTVSLPRGKTISLSYSGNLKYELLFFILIYLFKILTHLHVVNFQCCDTRHAEDRRKCWRANQQFRRREMDLDVRHEIAIKT